MSAKIWRGQNGPLLFDIQSDENALFEVVKVPKAESVAFDNFDEVVSSL